MLRQLAGASEMLEPMFEIMPGTKAAPKTPKPKDEMFTHDMPMIKDP